MLSAMTAQTSCGGRATNIHESDAVAGKPCVTCHSAAYQAALSPKHLGVMPETCETCHSTRAWSPASGVDHAFWPLRNKHAAIGCTTCHTSGFEKGKTPTDCQSCHRKDYDAAKPGHVGFPLDCALCHSDAAFRPSTFNHPWPLAGAHAIAPCAGCHAGEPPRYKGTPTLCTDCHQEDADRSTFPGHAGFPRTCNDCHLRSGWKPAVTGLHPEPKFPLKTGKHADARIGCQDCHVLVKGTSAGGQNTDCVNCHLGSHVRPAIDARHTQLGVPNYPAAPGTTNFCLQCHPTGVR